MNKITSLAPLAPPKKKAGDAKKATTDLDKLHTVVKKWEEDHPEQTFKDFLDLDKLIADNVGSSKYGGAVYYSYTHLLTVMKFLDKGFYYVPLKLEYDEHIDGIAVGVDFWYKGEKNLIPVRLSPMEGAAQKSIKTHPLSGNALDWKEVLNTEGRALAKALAFNLGLGMSLWTAAESIIASMSGLTLDLAQVQPVIQQPIQPVIQQPIQPIQPVIQQPIQQPLQVQQPTAQVVVQQPLTMQQPLPVQQPVFRVLPVTQPVESPEQVLARIQNGNLPTAPTQQAVNATVVANPVLPTQPIRVAPQPTGGIPQDFIGYLMNVGAPFKTFAGNYAITNFGVNSIAQLSEPEKAAIIASYEQSKNE